MKNCLWLFAGKTAICGKSCRGDYCFKHKRFNPLLPCKQCGKGTRKELCGECVDRCKWLKLGKSETCGKSCDGIYCVNHSKKTKTTVPCIRCNRGTYGGTCGKCKKGEALKPIEFKETKTAMKGFFKTYEAKVNYKDPNVLFEAVKNHMALILEGQNKNVKFNVGIKTNFHRGGEVAEHHFSTKSQPYLRGEEEIDFQFEKFLELIAQFVNKGSNWILDEIETVYLNIGENNPIKGGTWVDLPPKLKAKKACINVKNNGNDCSRVVIKSALFPVEKNADRLSSYPADENDGLNFDGITFPTPIKEWGKIEKQNIIAVNVYGWQKEKVVIYRITKSEEKQINVLLYNKHYVLIKI